jgi:hypothetical protein
MPRAPILLLCVALLTSCVSAQTRYESDLVDYRIKQSAAGINVDAPATTSNKILLDEHGRRWTEGTHDLPSIPRPPVPPPPSTPGPSVGEVIGAILLLPLIVPLAMLESYPSYRGAHCYSYTYKDQYHAKCY